MKLPFVPGCASVASVPSSDPNDCIRLRGVHQNNLKGFDLDLPLGRYVVVTGLSGTGKSSLVFDTLHAEGQRRYVETFSAYTRQFLDLLPKPRVDSIENIRPSIAIQQTNTVKTSRSTVGTMTEITDFFKVWFSHVAECFDPATGEKVEDDQPASIWQKARSALPEATVIVAFQVTRPANLSWPEILKNLKAQSYVRVLVPIPSPGGTGILPVSDGLTQAHGQDARATKSHQSSPSSEGGALRVHRVDDLLAQPRLLTGIAHVFVAQDRVGLAGDQRSRFLEAAETALHFGHGEVRLFRETVPGHYAECGHYSRGLHSPKTGRTFRAATPALFSFNSPLGACPQCRGFGRIIDVDYRLAIPDHSLSLDAGAIKPWEGEIYGESKRDLYRFAKKLKIPTDVPFASLTAKQKDFIINGDPDYDKPGKKLAARLVRTEGFLPVL